MNKEQFINTLQACYFGDRGAFNKILKEYEGLKERIEYLERSNNRREDTIIAERDENIELSNKIDKAIEYINIVGIKTDKPKYFQMIKRIKRKF